MRICLLVAALVSILNGCTPVAVLPDVAKPTVTTAQVVVTQSCVSDVPVPPAWATDALPKDANEFQRARALLAERLQSRDYVARLQIIIAACKGL